MSSLTGKAASVAKVQLHLVVLGRGGFAVAPCQGAVAPCHLGRLRDLAVAAWLGVFSRRAHVRFHRAKVKLHLTRERLHLAVRGRRGLVEPILGRRGGQANNSSGSTTWQTGV